jgi:hypothetical protein
MKKYTNEQRKRQAVYGLSAIPQWYLEIDPLLVLVVYAALWARRL